MSLRNKNPFIDPEDIFQSFKKEKLKEKYSAKPLNIIDYAEKLVGEKLFDSQKIILKFFYAGTKFNEDLRITEYDLTVIKGWELEQSWIFNGEKNKLKAYNKNIVDKNSWFSDLVLILGRRSGKSYISSLIASYEAYKLICLKNPQKFYEISSGTSIWIINTAVNAEQAQTIIFSALREFIHKCPVFEGRIAKETVNSIYLYTDADLEENEKIKKVGGRPKDGSVVVASGNSNSAALRGHTVAAVIYDEMAHYVTSDGKASAEEVYQALSPSTATFKPFGDGRNIVISSPDLPHGFFWDHYNNAKDLDSMMLFQLPTWDANPRFTKETFKDAIEGNEERAMAEYGAMFRSSAGNAFLPTELIDLAFNRRENWYMHKTGLTNYEYYMHIDPASNSDRYALMIAHPEYKYDTEARKNTMHVIEDLSLVFTAPPGGVIDPDDIMDIHILPLFKSFRIVSVTFDSMFSLEQQKKLRKSNINFRSISFNGANKNEIYSTMKDLFIQERITLCRDDSELRGELKNITINWTKTPPKISKNPNNKDFPNDDLPDCLGGVIHSMMTGATGRTKLPRTITVRTGIR